MEKRGRLWKWAGFLLVGGLGALLHFTYQWSGESAIAAIFSSVNESTWEHMKLLVMPALLFTAVQAVMIGRCYPNFLAVRALSLLAGAALIPVLFYTYTGVLGRSIDSVNIAVFFAADLGLFLLDGYLRRRNRLSALWQQVAGLLVLWLLAFAFVWCTFRPGSWAVWQDPVTGQFGQ